MHCDGWDSIFCNPERPAFLGEVPINLEDVLSQVKRWSFGHLEVLSCKYSPLTFGTKALGLLRANCYIHYVFWPIWCIPVTLYACVPQLSLLNNISIFPRFLIHGSCMSSSSLEPMNMILYGLYCLKVLQKGGGMTKECGTLRHYHHFCSPQLST